MSSMTETTPAPPTGGRPNILPVVITFLIGGALILTLGFWAGSRERGPAKEIVPQLTLIEPTDGAVVGQPLELLFEAPARLGMGPGGWGTRRLHLHALVDGVEIMPAATDIQAVGENRYRWVLSNISPGRHEIRLQWAGLDHRPISEGASETVVIEVRPE